jgi:hypothetical protein
MRKYLSTYSIQNQQPPYEAQLPLLLFRVAREDSSSTKLFGTLNNQNLSLITTFQEGL